MKKISYTSRLAHIAGALCALGFTVAVSAQNLVTNGQLTGPIPPSNGTTIPSLPPGWAAGARSVDMLESGGLGFFGEQLPNSPGGTEFVAAIGGASAAST